MLYVSVSDWRGLAQSQADQIAIEPPKDCRARAPYLQSKNLAVAFVGDGKYVSVGDHDATVTSVLVECSRENVF
ncbi:hypothetical protein [Enterovibrio nigricans]|uniref:Uncharacterized protein n=1 Tax=Enterovibrio nigricans DSM 22720 TaxID=1121868 RepID=A0A1T4UTR8_9GAMM|nr:hypothetical protein [Enterovibrio nigricans]PKF50955.1 hypothetical protein AT251_07565 [Enterovibrio nigricans]SKA56060.1 hypothetical protein SAMN02745132_02504 [Enterovibrio nigricans DSM 22720]